MFDTGSFDPYEILGLDSGATEDQIRKQYKTLSLKYHPDRMRSHDEAAQQEAQSIFIQISKAYTVLTDEDVRQKYEETGNPDGIRNFTLGIALPAWVVGEGNFSILGIYCLIFGIVLPLIIARWWFKSKSMTKYEVSYSTMALYYNELKESFNPRQLLELVSASLEFKDRIPWRTHETEALTNLVVVIKTKYEGSPLIAGDKFDRNKKFNAPYSTKTFALLLAHLYRIKLAEDPKILKDLENDQRFVIVKAFHLLNGLAQIALAKDWVPLYHCLITLGSCIVQSIAGPEKQLLQLPYLSEEVGTSLKDHSINGKKTPVRTTKELLNLESFPELGLEESQLSQLMFVARSFPKVCLIKPSIGVLGQDKITAGSLITAAFYLCLTTDAEQEAKCRGVNRPSELVLDEDQEHFSINMKSGEKKAKESSGSLVPVHCPYFPQELTYSWVAMLSSPGAGFILNPFKVRSIPLATDYLPDEFEDITADNQLPQRKLLPALVLQFPAPNQPTNMTLCLDLRCEVAFGVDFKCDIKINILPRIDDPTEKEAYYTEEEYDSE